MDKSRLTAMDQKVMEEMDEDVDYLDSIKDLEVHRDECAKHGKYVEARMADNRIKEIKANKKKAKLKRLKALQSDAMETAEEYFKDRLLEVNEIYDKKIADYEENMTEQEQNLNQVHSDKLEKVFNTLDSTLPKKGKPSVKYLDIKKQEEILALDRRYEEAHDYQLQAAKIEIEDDEKYEIMRAKKLDEAVKKQENTNKVEYEGWTEKYQAGKRELEKKRALEVEETIKMKTNKIKMLGREQGMEANRIANKKSGGIIGSSAKFRKSHDESRASQSESKISQEEEESMIHI